MNFLKRHYEKLILAVMLVIFLVSLFYQVDIITGENKITAQDLKLPPMHADFENTNFSDSKFDNKTIFLDKTAWVKTVPKDPSIKVHTDLLNNFEASRCPHCKKIVPRYFFYNKPHKCPICSGDLPEPPPPDGVGPKLPENNGKGDADGDGIPDNVENMWGTNPNVADSESDKDGDGFANIYEYKHNTDGSKVRSHPPLCLRLYLQEIRRSPLDIKLKKITTYGESDKNKWDVQVNTKNGTKSRFLVLGDTIKIGPKDYKLVDIVPKTIQERRRNVMVKVDVSEIILKALKGNDTITAVRNTDVYSSKPQAALIDELDGREYVVEEGAKMTLGDNNTGRESYMVVKVDPTKERVTLQDIKRKKTCFVGKELKIPRIRKVEANPGMDGMMEDPSMMGDPSLRRGNQPNNRRRNFTQPLI